MTNHRTVFFSFCLVIVLLVSFFSLGWRTGMVVALSIPLVLAMTFVSMKYFDIGLHKISLGALVLALGLMVDDAIIVGENIYSYREEGYSLRDAAVKGASEIATPLTFAILSNIVAFLPLLSDGLHDWLFQKIQTAA